MMRHGPVRQSRTAFRRQPSHSIYGFTIIELIVVLAIMLILTAITLPKLMQAAKGFRLRGAVSAVTSTIQSTRYRALAQGCQFQVVFTAATVTSQVQTAQLANNQCMGAGVALANFCPPNAPGAVACPNPLASGAAVTLNANTTLTFTPGGQVLLAGAVPVPCNPCLLTITYQGKSGTITVSRYGNVNVQYP